MSELYPAIKPFFSEMLAVSDGHSLYLEQSGNPKGIPVLFLHGGPGAGLFANYRRFFDPQKYWIIGFDQRGSGQSTPFGSVEHNTTENLLNDISQIREYLGVQQWVLFGGSWGATLALLAAIARPESVKGLVLRGSFLARAEDFAWYLDEKGGAAQLFPDYYQEFVYPVQDALATSTLVDAYYALFTGSDEIHKMAAIKAWCLWEARISRLHCKMREDDLLPDVHRGISLAKLECHYIKHQCFIEPNYILDNISKIQHIPATIIHGRYDCVCKIQGAFALNQHWPASQLTIVPESGHSANEPKISAALCLAATAMADFIKENK
ncbi:prolyl aminopeptidase [Paraglaciecola polaris]|uniref:Proline iminopeptidase n=1 Tax=Paraglaciecola polaris LMG 21857 TaxID=1129793 RepID=K6ZQ64_9ALTE|nr:prolyl aminopeptidase [Paraglaciecola polaris]GAC32417.1 proline iminopeptidase [Paraglaciecola polaris LMG 21857]